MKIFIVISRSALSIKKNTSSFWLQFYLHRLWGHYYENWFDKKDEFDH